MALDPPTYKTQVAQRPFAYAMQIMLSVFASTALFVFLIASLRAVQPFMTSPGDNVLFGLGTTFAFLVASLPFIYFNGGFVLWEHVLTAWVVGGIAYWVAPRIHRNSNVLYKALAFLPLVYYTLGNIGGLLGATFEWLIFGNAGQGFAIMSPGPWPGYDASFALQAFAAEAIAAFFVGIFVYFLYIRDRILFVPIALAFGYGAMGLLLFSVSGGAFTLWTWVWTNTVACWTPLGCFPDQTNVWWYAYVFGPLTGMVLAAIVAYIVAGVGVDYGAASGTSDSRVAAAAPSRRRRRAKESDRPGQGDVSDDVFDLVG
jgi:hypothetical protein